MPDSFENSPIIPVDDEHIRCNRRQFLAATTALALSAPAAMAAESVQSTAAPDEVWDGHCHLSGFEGKTPQERAERLLTFADRLGIDRAIIFMGWPFVNTPDPDEIIRQNNQVLDAIKLDPQRLMGYVYLNPTDVAGSLQEIQRCVIDGPMVGVKLWVAGRCDQKNLDPILELATEINAVVYQHTWIKTTGNLPGESTPEELVALSRRHPQARLICGHAGGNWELGIRSVLESPTLMLEVAGSDPTAGFTEMALRELSADRILFGSDAGGRSFASQLAKVAAVDMTSLERQKILGGNLRKMLQPILRHKGLPT